MQTVQADYYGDVGFDALQAKLGAGMPDGTGVRVTLVETCTDAPVSCEVWAPNPGSRSITDGDGGPPVSEPYSGHATGSASRFFGDISTTPGIGVAPSPSVSAYEANRWIYDAFLRFGDVSNREPKSSSSRVANHSWVGARTDDADNLVILRRLDWLIDTDEFIQVAGFTNNSSSLLSSGFNVIAINRTNHPTNWGSPPVAGDPAYGTQRTRPDLVVPTKYTSQATPRAASAAALLVNVAQLDPSLSNGSTTNRSGDTILNAARSEVVKAALMAGADRAVTNTEPAENPAGITDYRAKPADQTDNGLDRRYGAGQLNIYNSYQIIAAGEQDSREDNGNGTIGAFGFDYNPAFGGASSSDTRGTYFFSTGDEAVEFFATLAWNIDIDPGQPSAFAQPATLRNLDLFLYDVSDSQNWFLLSQSTSTINNTENIRHLLAANTDYALRVRPASGEGQFLWDYAMAWRSHVPGDINADGSITVSDLLLMQQAIDGRLALDRQQLTRADTHPAGGNGTLNVSDLIVLQQITRTP